MTAGNAALEVCVSLSEMKLTTFLRNIAITIAKAL